ncbi:hypothetical protein GY45DRAFT_1034578 [Cubamyces sp. BRFM 1775]|nr:hypothetical protein GY45DRAFT_1034578 [Cubamyces sp. BRFM 1775]
MPDLDSWHLLADIYTGILVTQCASLESLHLNYQHNLWEAEDRSPALLEALCEVLSRQPAPLPMLSNLKLGLATREYGGDLDSPSRMPFASGLRARFAQCLLDDRRYLQFRRLALCLSSERWADRCWTWKVGWPEKHWVDIKEALARTWLEDI